MYQSSEKERESFQSKRIFEIFYGFFSKTKGIRKGVRDFYSVLRPSVEQERLIVISYLPRQLFCVPRNKKVFSDLLVVITGMNIVNAKILTATLEYIQASKRFESVGNENLSSISPLSLIVSFSFICKSFSCISLIDSCVV